MSKLQLLQFLNYQFPSQVKLPLSHSTVNDLRFKKLTLSFCTTTQAFVCSTSALQVFHFSITPLPSPLPLCLRVWSCSRLWSKAQWARVLSSLLSEAQRQGKQKPHSSLPQITSSEHNTQSQTHKHVHTEAAYGSGKSSECDRSVWGCRVYPATCWVSIAIPKHKIIQLLIISYSQQTGTTQRITWLRWRFTACVALQNGSLKVPLKWHTTTFLLEAENQERDNDCPFHKLYFFGDPRSKCATFHPWQVLLSFTYNLRSTNARIVFNTFDWWKPILFCLSLN